MNTDLLKKKILDLAIRGKLVEQRPEEGTVEDLYKQIQEEKANLIKEGKLKKEKPIPPIESDEIPFVLPDSWKWCRLKDICNSFMVPQRDKPKVFDGSIPWCRIEDIEGIYLSKTHTNKYVSVDTVKAMNLKVYPIGTVVTANSASIGVTAITTVECCTNQTFIGIVVNEKILLNYYLLYFLKSQLSNLKKIGTGTTISYISREKYENYVIPLPPLAEQKRIVEKIDLLFSRSHAVEDGLVEIDKLSDLTKKKILELAIKGKLVEQRPEEGTAEDLYQQIQEEKQKLIKEGKLYKEKLLSTIDDEIPFEIPSNWKWVRLNDVVSKNIKRGKSPKYVEKSGVLVFAQKCNSKYDGIRLELALHLDESKLDKYSETEFLRDKDSIINSTGGGTMGRVGIYQNKDNPENIPLVPDSHVTVIRSCNHVDAKYIYFYLKTQQPKLENLGDGSTNQTELRPDTLKQLYLPLPPLAEQKRIVAKIEELLALCDKLKLK